MCKDGSFISIDPKCVHKFISDRLNHYGDKIPECPAGFRFTGRMLDTYHSGAWILLPNGKAAQVSLTPEQDLYTGWRFELEKIEPRYRYICDEDARHLVYGDWYKSSISLGFSAEFSKWIGDKPSTFKDFPFRREEIK